MCVVGSLLTSAIVWSIHARHGLSQPVSRVFNLLLHLVKMDEWSVHTVKKSKSKKRDKHHKRVRWYTFTKIVVMIFI